MGFSFHNDDAARTSTDDTIGVYTDNDQGPAVTAYTHAKVGQTSMRLSMPPDEARKLAAALLEAADEADWESGK